MIDVVSPALRSKMMSGIRGKNTIPEIVLRKYLHAKGYRFRLHSRNLPGKPDLVLARYRLAIFVHGCFWHSHMGCFFCRTPATRTVFWQKKLRDNQERDSRQVCTLLNQGWRVLIVWECGLKLCSDELHSICSAISSDIQFSEWPSRPPKPTV